MIDLTRHGFKVEARAPSVEKVDLQDFSNPATRNAIGRICTQAYAVLSKTKGTTFVASSTSPEEVVLNCSKPILNVFGFRLNVRVWATAAGVDIYITSSKFDGCALSTTADLTEEGLAGGFDEVFSRAVRAYSIRSYVAEAKKIIKIFNAVEAVNND